MRVAVVTGASAGIGREFVYAIDRQENLDEIWVIARRADRLEELKDKCRTPVRPIVLDLSELRALDDYKAILESERPEIAILVNAAGFGVLIFDTGLVKHAEVIWIQPNALSHPMYWRVLDTARTYGKPVRYFAFASWIKCAEQVLTWDQSLAQ